MALSSQTVTAAAGSIEAHELTAEQVQKSLVQPLEAASVFLAAGPRIFDTAGPLRLPKAPVSQADALKFYGENELIGEVDPTFDEISLMPSTMKSIKVLTRYSNELSRQSVISLDAALKDRMVADVAAKVDTQFLGVGGDGISEPKGLFGFAGVQTIAVGGALTLDVLLDAWGKALAANVSMGSLKWVMTPAEFVALRKLKDGQNRYMLQADPTTDGVFRLWGAPVVVSARIPAGNAALVDFSQIAVARDASPSVRFLTETFGQYDQQAIRVVSRFDAAPMNPEAIVTLTGIA